MTDTAVSTVRRMGTGWVDTSRTCVRDGCGAVAPAQPWQLDGRPAMLRTEAEQLAAKAKELHDRADRIEADNARAAAEPAPSWLCPADRVHLHRGDLLVRWGSGSPGLPVDQADIEELNDWLDAHRPGRAGACHVCAPGSKTPT